MAPDWNSLQPCSRTPAGRRAAAQVAPARHGLLVTDAHASYGAFASAHGIAHQTVNLRQGQRMRASMRGAIHVQNVNAYHQRFRQWLARFRGVASRYLANYLDWRWALDGGEYAQRETLLQLAIKPNNRWR